MTTTERDFAAEMRQVIDQHTADGPYLPPIAASEVVEKLRANDPDLLDGWLHAQADRFVWQAINDRDRSRRSHVAQTAQRSAFGKAASEHADGNRTALRAFLDSPYTVQDGSRRRLADLRHEDLVYVAERYDARARENAMRAAFMTALSKKVKRGVVADHFTEEKLTAMWQSLDG